MLKVSNATRGKLLADRAEEATSFARRLVGLMGRRRFEFGEGLHIVPCNAIHTFFMRLPIDALFLDEHGTVIKAFPALPPWRVTGVYLNARSVLELPTGVIAGSGTEEGDRIVFEQA